MVRFYALLSILLFGIFFSCNDKGNFDIGSGLVDTESSIYETQDFTVSLSTVIIDSIRTSQASRLLVGKHSSNVTGSLETVSYFSINMNSDLASINKNEVGEFLDSLKLTLHYSDFYIGDTTKQVTIQLFRLTDRLKYVKNTEFGDHFYNTTSFPHEANPIAEFDFFPEPTRRERNKRDSIVLNVDLGFAQDLIDFDQNYLNKGDDATDQKEKYQDFIKGFALKLKSDDLILSFGADTANVKFDLYTHMPDYYDRVNRYRISIASGISSDKNNFIQAISDRSTTAFAPLNNQKESLPSVNSGDRTFVQGLGGIVTRVDFPNMNDVFAYDDRVIVKAELILYASQENDSIPKVLNFLEVGKNNLIGNALMVQKGSQTEYLRADRRQDKNHYDHYYYATDITQFLTSKLGNYHFDTNNGLIVTVPMADLQSKTDRLILNGENTPRNFSPKLKLYFLKYE